MNALVVGEALAKLSVVSTFDESIEIRHRKGEGERGMSQSFSTFSEGLHLDYNLFALLTPSVGFEPTTKGLEIPCSIP